MPESVAADYDASGGAKAPAAIEPVMGLLSGLVGEGPAPEFAAGTVRIVGPLAARGSELKGIELIRAMAARIGEKPDAADRWTASVITAHTRLRLARPLAADCRLPWQRPLPRGKLTPARVRAGYRRIHPMQAHPASSPKSTRASPGRPKGSKNRTKAAVRPVAKAA